MSDFSKGYYVLTIHNENKEPYHWVLKAPNHEIVLTSETYTTKQGAINGIESVQEHCQNLSNYEKEDAKDGSPYFNLKAKNHKIIGTSEMYSSNQSREKGINAVIKYGVSLIINDKTSLCNSESKKKEKIVIINGRKYTVSDKYVSYEDILSLANIKKESQTSIIIVVFEKAENGKEGTLSPEDKIKVKDGMVFNVSTTNKS